MYNLFFSNIISIVISVAGNLSLAWIFLRALIYPFEHAEFIFNTGLLFFLVEFLSVHSSGMFINMPHGRDDATAEKWLSGWSDPRIGKWLGVRGTKIFILSIYTLLVGIFAAVFKNWFIPGYFFISLTSKIFGRRAIPHKWIIFAQIFIFLGSLVLIGMLSEQIVHFFPLPPEIFVHKPPAASGTFVDNPQTLLVWGVFYFSLLILLEIALFVWKFGKKQNNL